MRLERRRVTVDVTPGPAPQLTMRRTGRRLLGPIAFACATARSTTASSARPSGVLTHEQLDDPLELTRAKPCRTTETAVHPAHVPHDGPPTTLDVNITSSDHVELVPAHPPPNTPTSARRAASRQLDNQDDETRFALAEKVELSTRATAGQPRLQLLRARPPAAQLRRYLRACGGLPALQPESGYGHRQSRTVTSTSAKSKPTRDGPRIPRYRASADAWP